MNVKRPHFWIAAVSATAVLTVALVDMGATSPGPLTTAHERHPDLSGNMGCAACHGGWFTSMTEACLDCHEVIGRDVEEGKGLHGALERATAMQCARCHSDHHGPDFPVVNASSFRLAGVPDVQAFEHDFVGFAMDGKHLELECSECHANAEVLPLPEGEHRFLGLDQDCAACHEDAHDGEMRIGCASCHGQVAFDELEATGHDEFLPLVGGHGDVACADCHARGRHVLEKLGRHRRRDFARQCMDCHESPHAADFTEGIADLVEMPAGASCVVCHEAEHTTFQDELLEITPAQHRRSGFALEAPHDEVSCEECHAPELGDFAARYPGRGATECQACHDDPHGGQFEAGPFAGQGCIACHDRHAFEPHAFTVELHELASLALTGSHLDAECDECHEIEVEGEPRVFHGTASDCEDCHADAHRGFFAPVEEELASTEHGACAACHLTTTFDELPADGFAHGRFTDFAVLGAHAQGECEECHPRAHEPDDRGRTFGWVEEHFGVFEGCATCHEDPHHGEFDKPGLPRAVEGREDCARCHVQTSFRAFEPGHFDHALWTDFPLQGVHGEIGCSACHEPLRAPDELGRTWGRADGSRCSDCHADSHEDQFAVDGATDCKRCHDSARSWSTLRFNHQWDSRFPLSDAHAQVPCSSCHVSQTFDSGVEAIRYRPIEMDCVHCHGTHEGPVIRRKGKKQ